MQALNTPGMIDWAPIEAWMRDFYLPRYKLQQIIKMSAVVNDVEVKEEYIRRNIDYTISALHVPKNSIQDRVIKPGEKELKNEYKNRIDEFEELEKRHISFVSWPKTASLEDTNRTKEEAFEIIENYKNGTDFSVLANIHTQDPGNQIAPDSGRGGDLGWFEKGQMVKSFEDAAFKGRRGSVVGPVLSQFGYHIIKIDSIKNRGKNNHQVKARHILLKVELGQKTRSGLRRKATLFSYDAQDYGLPSAIDTHSVNIQQAENLKENDFFISQVGPFRSAVRWVFNSKIDDISDPLETESYYAVLKLDSITPAGVEDFDNVKDKIYRDLISENEFDATNLYAEEISETDVDMYKSLDGWTKFKTEYTIIKIKGEPSKKIKLRWSENGPVLDKNTSQISDIIPPNHEMALSWTMLSPKDTSMSSLINLPYSKDLTTALKSLEKHVAPSLNYTIVDRENIALQLAGKLPKRNKDHNTQGRLPSFGYVEKNRWSGYKERHASKRQRSDWDRSPGYGAVQ